MVYKVPDNVVNKKLYLSIKKDFDRELKKKNKRWNAYTSGRLVRTYKDKGGKYKGKKPKRSGGIGRWFDEEWIDTCKLPKKVPCGRKSVGKSYSVMKKTFPYCRPYKRINKGTPKTVKELSKAELKRRCKSKRKSPKKVVR